MSGKAKSGKRETDLVRLSAMATQYKLRPVRLSDTATLVHQRQGMFRDMGDLREREIRPYLPVFSRWFRREFRARRIWGFLAETADGQPVAGGLAWLRPRHPGPRFPHTRIPYLLSVYTDPAHRRRGLGARVVAALIDSARARGFPRVELDATKFGRPVYERLGFQPTNQMRLSLESSRRANSGRASPPLRRVH